MCSGRSAGLRRATRSTAASTAGTGRKDGAGMRRTTSKDHHGAHVVDSNVVGGARRPFAGHFPLDDEVRPRRSPAVRVVEEMAQDRRRGAEGH